MKSQGLPMYVIAIIVIGLIVLVVFLLYSFGVWGHGKGLLNTWTKYGNQTAVNASKKAQQASS